MAEKSSTDSLLQTGNSYSKEDVLKLANNFWNEDKDCFIWKNWDGQYSIIPIGFKSVMGTKIKAIRANPEETLTQYPYNRVDLHAAARKIPVWEMESKIDLTKYKLVRGTILPINITPAEEAVMQTQEFEDQNKPNTSGNLPPGHVWNPTEEATKPDPNSPELPAYQRDKDNKTTVIFFGIAAVVVLAVLVYHFFIRQ